MWCSTRFAFIIIRHARRPAIRQAWQQITNILHATALHHRILEWNPEVVIVRAVVERPERDIFRERRIAQWRIRMRRGTTLGAFHVEPVNDGFKWHELQ
jgi:hypothetical protein